MAQAPSPDPTAWRPFAYADLRNPSAATATYADLWREVLEGANKVHPAQADDLQLASGKAPATEAHFVIWSASRSVVLSVLDTVKGCTLKSHAPAAGAVIKLCPMRVAIYEGVTVRTFEAGRGCMLEQMGLSDHPTRTADRGAAYASYDVAARTIHVGLIVDHQTVQGCSLSVPLPPRSPYQ